jgi:hypothetical protein
MPREITTKMGILFESLPDEVEAEKDQLLLAMLLTLLSEDKKQLVRTLLGEPYYQAKMRKAEKVIAIYENNGVVNVSENPGMTTPDILVSSEELRKF